MIQLTANITLNNINRLRAKSVNIDTDLNTVFVTVQATQIGGNVYGTYQLQVLNGSSIGLRANPAPTGASDAVQAFTVSTATGFTDISAAFATVGSLAAKLSAVEAACISAGLLPAGTVS